jgi:tyrosyl-tRNA synthetase
MVPSETIKAGVNIVDFLTDHANVLPSKSEARRNLKENAISVNKDKVTENTIINSELLLNGKYILVQKGRKNYYLVTVK